MLKQVQHDKRKNMEIDELIQKCKDMPTYLWEREFNEFLRHHSRYSNLDEKNKKVILDLVKKFRPYLIKGIKVSEQTIQRESYNLYQNRIKLDLTENDLAEIKEILHLFKK
jgi:hypothetical protein